MIKNDAQTIYEMLFDKEYYVQSYPDLKNYSGNLFKHYEEYGWKEKRNPHPLFNTRWYLDNNIDVKEKNINPFRHYIEYGFSENRIPPHPLIDVDWYTAQTGYTPSENIILHYMEHCKNFNISLHPLFNPNWYIGQNKELNSENINPFFHFLNDGWKKNKSPHPLFDMNWYCLQYGNIIGGINPLIHYVLFWKKCNTNPNPLFNSSFYYEKYCDSINYAGDPLSHFVKTGAQTGCSLNIQAKNIRTEKENFESAINMYLEDSDIDYISFDVFDTTILRPFLSYDCLFDYLEIKMKNQIGSMCIHYKKMRMQAEKNIRDDLKKNHLLKDPTLYQIYEYLCNKANLNKSFVKLLMDIEIEAEYKLCYKREYIYSLYKKALQSGKKIIFCSDTYFSKSVIKHLLEKNGYTEYSKIYVSSELGKTKKFGHLFEHIQKDLGIQKNEIVHIGDNLHSDIYQAREYGIHSLHIPSTTKTFFKQGCINERIWNIEYIQELPFKILLGVVANKLTDLQENHSNANFLYSHNPYFYGYYALGPLLLTVTQWLHEQCKNKGQKTVHFLSRDGYLPMKALQILNKRIASKTTINCKYIHISRRALLPYFLAQINGIQHIFSIHSAKNFTVLDFLRNFNSELFEIMSNDFIKKEMFFFTDPLNAHREKLIEYFEQKIIEQDFVQVLQKNIKNISQYYTKSVYMDNNKDIVVFDVGRKATFQYFLGQLLHVNTFGLYMLTEGANFFNVKNDSYSSFLGNLNRHIDKEAPCTIPYEVFFSEQAPSVVAFDDLGDPIFNDKYEKSSISSEVIKRIQKAALDFISDVSSIFQDDTLNIRLTNSASNFLLHKTWYLEEERKLLHEIVHEDSMSSSGDISLATYRATSSPKKKKRLLIYCPAMSRLMGGAERVASYLANHYSLVGIEVLVLSSGRANGKSLKSVYELNADVRLEEINVSDYDAIYNRIKKFNPHLTLVMASGAVVKNFVAACVALKKRIILSERASPQYSFMNYWASQCKEDYLLTYLNADVIVVQFDSFKNFFPEPCHINIKCIPNPVRELNIEYNSDSKIIVNIARHSQKQKQQHILIEAFAKISHDHPEWKLELWGELDNIYTPVLRHLIEAYNLQNSVSIEGRTDNIHSVLSRAAIHAFPSSYEGFPNALAETLSVGIPSIGFIDCPGTNELIRDGYNGLLAENSHDSDSFAIKLKHLMVSKENRMNFSHNARISMQKYSYCEVIKGWDDLVFTLLAEYD